MMSILKSLRDYVGFRIRGVPDKIIKSAGKNFSCGFGAFFRPNEKIIIGNDVFIGRYTHIAAPCVIKDDVMLASYVAFVGGDHKFDKPGILMNASGKGETATIIIEEEVWLGHGVIVLAGVTVGRGAIVASGSVVTKSVPPCTIWGGNPARFIRNRFGSDEDTRQHLNFLNAKYDSTYNKL